LFLLSFNLGIATVRARVNDLPKLPCMVF